MKPNQSSSSTNYSQQIPSANMGYQLPFNLYDNYLQQINNMKQEIDQLKVSQNIQNIKHQIEMNQMKKSMNQMKKSMFNQENKHNLEMKNLINKFQRQETMLREEIRVQALTS